MRLRLTLRAYGDLETIDTYFANESPAAGRDVFAAIEKAFEQLMHMPRLGRPTNTRSVRCLTLLAYPYKIFYRLNDDVIEILAVFHARQDPDKASF